MLRKLEAMIGFHVEGTDGEMGRVRDVYFDDHEWMMRYLVVETGSWLTSKLVLISPACVGAPDWQEARIPVALTRNEVAESPDIDFHRPVSRQQLAALHDHYGWPTYWGAVPDWEMGFWPELPVLPQATDEERAIEAEAEQGEVAVGDPYLRSVREVTGYRVYATDGVVGHVIDFFADEGTWRIEYMLVDTRNLLPGRHVLITPLWISEVCWPERKVYINETRAKVKDSPRYDPLSGALSRERERELRA